MNIRRKESDHRLSRLAAAWNSLNQEMGIVRTKADYARMSKLLDELVDEIGDDSKHPLAGLADIVATLIERYEDQSVKIPEAAPADVLRYLMELHGLKQNDLGELGSQGVVSEVLNGKRMINARQAKALAARFNVSPAVFL